MNDREFVRRARACARKTGQEFLLDPRVGKGSHVGIYVGTRFTILPHGEIRPGTFYGLLRDLGIDRKEF